MCGIAGWIDFNSDLRHQGKVINSMCATLEKRGPNASGTYLSSQAILGHRRLVVIDPEGGGQPMSKIYAGKSYTITYNGELYNTLEIRQLLESYGHLFLSRNSDTEVLLTAYIHWGKECVKKFNGIFAFAIWDESEQSLFMARDRLGVKPLFYSRKGKRLLFASEIKALLAHPGIKAEIDREGLAEIFAMGPARTPGLGVFKGIHELKPGHTISYNRNEMQIERYWQLESAPHQEDLETTTAHLRELLEDTVQRQLIADVPVCTLLSGGLDSSALTALAVRHFQAQDLILKTFSVNYRDQEQYFKANQFERDADAPWIKTVSTSLGTIHREIVIDSQELAGALPAALMANDLPGMTDIDASLLLFCQEIKKEAVVALSGECADEVFGGYPWFRQANSLQGQGFPWIRQLAARAQYLSPALLNSISMQEYAWERYKEALKEVPRLEGEKQDEASIRELFYLNISRFMPTLLDRKDRMSMACGLEVRVPFSDHRLVEYVWNIPWAMKNDKNMSKGILRRALIGLLPNEVLFRPKSPYPKNHHPQYQELIRSELQRIINDTSSPLLALINKTMIEQVLFSGRAFMDQPWFGQLMGTVQFMAYLIQINRWLQVYNINLCL